MDIFTVVMWIAICKSENLTIVKYIAAFPCIYFVINILCKCNIFGGDTINLIYNIQIYKYQDITSIYQLIPVMMVCTAIFLEAILLWFLFRKNIEIFIGNSYYTEQELCQRLWWRFHLQYLSLEIEFSFDGFVFDYYHWHNNQKYDKNNIEKN